MLIQFPSRLLFYILFALIYSLFNHSLFSFISSYTQLFYRFLPNIFLLIQSVSHSLFFCSYYLSPSQDLLIHPLCPFYNIPDPLSLPVPGDIFLFHVSALVLLSPHSPVIYEKLLFDVCVSSSLQVPRCILYHENRKIRVSPKH